MDKDPVHHRRRYSANPRQGVAGKHVDDAGAAEGGLEDDEARWVGGDLGDDCGLAAEGVGAERGYGGVG